MDKTSNWAESSIVSALSSFRNFHAVLLILTTFMGILLLTTMLQRLSVTGESVYPESAGVLMAQRWASGLPLYGDYRQPGYLLTAFPPLWYACLAVAAKLGLTDLDSLTVFGRILTLASLFGVSALGYFWNRRVGLSASLSLLAPAFYLSLPVLIPWAVNARPDFPALFPCFLALYWVAFRSSAPSTILAGFSGALGFLMRHNAVAAPVAIVLWLVWSRRWKRAVLFCASWAFVVSLMLVPFELSSHGLLRLNLSNAKFGPFALTYITDVLSRLLEASGQGFAVALFALGAFGFLESWNQREQRTRLLNIYLIVSLGLALLGSAAAGAGVNHYFEPALAMAALVPVGVARLQAEWRNDSPLALFAVVIVLVLLMPSLDSQRRYLKDSKSEDLRRFLPMIANRTVFTDIPYLAARTSTPQAVDLASLINTERKGGWASWSSAKLAQELRERKYELVILVKPVFQWPYDAAAPYPRAPRLDSEMQKAISENYGLCFELDSSNGGPIAVYSPFVMNSNSPSNNCPPATGLSPPQDHAGNFVFAK